MQKVSAIRTASITLDKTTIEQLVRLGNRALEFMESHPKACVCCFALGAFCSLAKTAINKGWTPEQVASLGKAFPIQISIPTLDL